MIGTSPQTVTHWFADRKTPTLEQGLAIQEILKMAEKEKPKSKGSQKHRTLAAQRAIKTIDATGRKD
jgi:hypothetical protein